MFLFSPVFYYTNKIDYFGVSIVIVLGGADSGQTSIKSPDLACNAESLPFKNYKDLTIKLEVKYIFPISPWGTNFYIYQLHIYLLFITYGIRMQNISTYGIRMQKNPQTRAGIFCNFADFHGIMQVQSPTYTPARIFYQWCC